MTYDEETKYQALSRIHAGEMPVNVAKDMEIPLTTVLRWNKAMKEAKEEGGLNALVNLDKVVVNKVVEGIVETEPELVEAAKNLTTQLDHAEKLRVELQTAALHIAAQAKSFGMKTEHTGDLLVITEVLCNLQNAFFNSNATQVNVQNNYGYQEFLSDEPAA
jgi:fructosamine-3-kinase